MQKNYIHTGILFWNTTVFNFEYIYQWNDTFSATFDSFALNSVAFQLQTLQVNIEIKKIGKLGITYIF